MCRSDCLSSPALLIACGDASGDPCGMHVGMQVRIHVACIWGCTAPHMQEVNAVEPGHLRVYLASIWGLCEVYCAERR